jgi:endonuclease/exonuclease/phosphatase family metal-dependent hydrolase
MKVSSIFFLAIFLFIGCCEQAGIDQTIRVMTFNIRLNTPSDSSDAWPFRKEMAASMIRFHKADLAGLQEALPGQIDDLQKQLPEFAWFGVGRDDGANKGEFSCIFYRKERFQRVNGSTFWLSETPDQPGKGWDAAFPRIVTWLEVKDMASGKTFYHFNTHFDHRGEIARKESAALLVLKVHQLAAGKPAVITGDFNCSAESVPYQIITGDCSGDAAMKFIDSKTIARYGHHGPTTTWTGFKSAFWPERQAIDHIFVSEGITVFFHGTLSDTFDGRFPSDHMPVIIEINMN